MEILGVALIILFSCIAGVLVFVYFNSSGEARRWERVDALEAEMSRLSRRLTALEGRFPTAAPAQPTRSLSDFSLPPAASAPSRPAPVSPVPSTSAAAPPPPVSPPPAAPVPEPAEKTELTLEERIGGQWLNWLGAVTLVFAVGLFLKWAYDMGWITPLFHLPPLAYLTCGWLVGTALLAGGEALARRLPLYAQGLIGAGVAALYVTTYAGHALYHTLAAGPATMGLMLVSAAAIGMALRHNSVVIAWLGVALAYVSPVILGGSGSPAPLFLYLTLLNAAVLGISIARRWTAFRMAGLLATATLYSGWHIKTDGMEFLGMALAFVVGNSLLFLLALTLPPLLRREPATESDLALAVLNPLLSFFAVYHLLQPAHAEWHGFAALAYAVVHGWLSRIARARLGKEDYLEQILFGITAAFVLLAIPLQWNGNVVTAGWALMGAAMVVVGYHVDSWRTARWGATYLGLAVARLVFIDAWKSPPPGAWMFLNERGVSFAVVICSLVGVAGVLARRWSGIGRGEGTLAGLLALLGFTSGALLDWWLLLDAPAAWFPVGWAVVGALVFAAGWRLRCRELRWTGLLFSLLPTAHVALVAAHYEVFFPTDTRMAPAWIAATTLSLALAACYQQDHTLEDEERGVAVPFFAGTAALVGLIATGKMLEHGWLSLAWLGIVAALLWAGVRMNRSAVWLLALPVAGLMTARFLSQELALPPDAPALFHPRSVAALATLAAWIATTVTLARRGTEAERGWLPALLLLTNLQALGWLSLEAMDVAGRIGPAAWAREASQFALSAVWVIYAAVSILLGLRRGSPGLRWGGISLLLVTVAKVYIFDLGFLPLGYRVLSFLVLALVLLGISYLYQRRAAPLQGGP